MQALIKCTSPRFTPPPPTARDAYEKIRPSVVAVRGTADDGEEGTKGMETGKQDCPARHRRGDRRQRHRSSPTCTSSPAPKRISVTFSDGIEVRGRRSSARSPRTTSPCCRRKTIPDDLDAGDAALDRATCAPGDEVVAVGFPFGIGPSVSAGVVSGLQARVPLARRQARADQPDPVRRRGQSRQLRRPAGHDGRRGRRHRHRASSTRREQRVFIGIGFAVPIENAAAAVGMPPF